MFPRRPRPNHKLCMCQATTMSSHGVHTSCVCHLSGHQEHVVHSCQHAREPHTHNTNEAHTTKHIVVHNTHTTRKHTQNSAMSRESKGSSHGVHTLCTDISPCTLQACWPVNASMCGSQCGLTLSLCFLLCFCAFVSDCACSLADRYQTRDYACAKQQR